MSSKCTFHSRHSSTAWPAPPTCVAGNPVNWTAEIMEANDYYPFGQVMPSRTYLTGSKKDRCTFNGKETDIETGLQDYGMRIYSVAIGRFLSEDPITKKYPFLTPYQFASNTPIQAIDMDGLEAFYVHGTWSDPSTFSSSSILTINSITKNTTGQEFKWSGNNTDEARRVAAEDLANHIMKYRDPKQPLTIIGHSHGGNVSILAANILQSRGIQVDILITFNTPVREYVLNEGAATKHINIYQEYDPVQGNAGNDINIPDGAIVIPMPLVPPIVIPTYNGTLRGTGEIGPAARAFYGAVNISVPFDIENVHNTHNTPSLWKDGLNEAVNAVKKPVDPFKIEPTKQDKTTVDTGPKK